MAKTVKTASSTADKNVDGLSEELVEDNIVVELTDEQQTHQVELKQLVKKEKLSILAFIINCFKVGKKLVELKKLYKEDFYNIVNTSIISKEQVRRRMKLVLRLDVDFSDAMSNKGTDFDREENVAMLIIDERIENLSIKDLKLAADLTLEKIADMKHLSDKDWHTVLTKSDKPYQAHQDKIKADNLKKATADKDKHIPDGMDKQDFYNQLDKGIYGVVSLLYTANTLNGGLEDKVSNLEEDNKSLSDDLLIANSKLEVYEKVPNKESAPEQIVKVNLSEISDSIAKQFTKKAS